MKEDLCEFDFGVSILILLVLQIFIFWLHTEVFAYSIFYFAFVLEFSGVDTTPIGRPSFSYSGKIF